jgi:hypothetical protein
VEATLGLLVTPEAELAIPASSSHRRHTATHDLSRVVVQEQGALLADTAALAAAPAAKKALPTVRTVVTAERRLVAVQAVVPDKRALPYREATPITRLAVAVAGTTVVEVAVVAQAIATAAVEAPAMRTQT